MYGHCLFLCLASLTLVLVLALNRAQQGPHTELRLRSVYGMNECIFLPGPGEWAALLHYPEGCFRGGEKTKIIATSNAQRGEEDSEEVSICLTTPEVPWLRGAADSQA